MSKSPIHVAVTGAAGAIGYAILFRLASGEVFGHDQPLVLRLVDIEPAVPVMGGVILELEDCASPVLEKVTATADPAEGFRGINWALMIGSVPRKPGMERKDLLAINGKIFTGQGQALQNHAAKDVRILVVGNPCNTNGLIAMNSAPGIPRDRWFAMTRLDENRAKAQLALKAGASVGAVSNLGVWGNHSPTMFPDFYHAKINGQPATAVIPDENWLRTQFVATVAQRGTAVLNARKLSSAASAANAAIDTIQSIINPTPAGDWHSVCVCSDGSYGVEKGLICSFPVRSDGKSLQIVPGLTLNDFSRAKITASVDELKGEKAIATELGLLK
ncbi:MAG: malate dehydrogenase [Verrucomicrobiota bacterium]|jgi:malate dehydrogenase